MAVRYRHYIHRLQVSYRIVLKVHTGFTHVLLYKQKLNQFKQNGTQNVKDYK